MYVLMSVVNQPSWLPNPIKLIIIIIIVIIILFQQTATVNNEVDKTDTTELL